MAETAGKRFNINEKSMKNGIYSCPPLEPLPSRNIPVDCFCERRPKSSISRRGPRAKRAFIIRAILGGGGVDKSTLTFRMPVATQHAPFRHTAAVSLHPRGRRRLAGGHSPLLHTGHPRKSNGHRHVMLNLFQHLVTVEFHGYSKRLPQGRNIGQTLNQVQGDMKMLDCTPAKVQRRP